MKSRYDHFCDLLWEYCRWKGIGCTDEDLRNTEYPYAEVLQRVDHGKVSLQNAMEGFALTVHRNRYRGRRIAEAS